MAIKESNYLMAKRVKSLKRPLTAEEQATIMLEVVKRVGPTMRDWAQYAGEDYVSGANLDNEGNALINRNVKLIQASS